ncbi:hypothetical protein VPBB_A1210 [Vibrio parahaemolyticus BB22OP]|nr:hypothetical protein VPBB_A1210 [Vibrio parahaemolyticus BB22OP]
MANFTFNISSKNLISLSSNGPKDLTNLLMLPADNFSIVANPLGSAILRFQ